MEIKQLKSFLCVAELLSFHKAAHLLHLSQPALSAQIRALEEDLGAILLERNRRVVRLTPAGELLFQDGKLLLNEATNLRMRILQTAGGNAGRLRVGFVASAGLALVPSILTTFRQRYPRIRFDLKNIRTVDQIVALQSGSFDAGFLRLPIPSKGLSVTLVHQEPFTLVTSKSHPLSHRRKVTLSDFASDDFLAYGRNWAPDFYDSWIAICNRYGFTPAVVQETAEMGTLLSLVAAGLGIAIVPEAIARRHGEDLKIRSLASEGIFSQIGLALPSSRKNPLAEKLLSVTLALRKDTRASIR